MFPQRVSPGSHQQTVTGVMVTTLSANLAPGALRLRNYADDPAWQRAWLSLEVGEWRSLAVIPTGDLCSLDLVHGLASVAWRQRGTPLVIADLRGIGLSALAAARGELRRRASSGERILVAVASFERNPTTATLVREVDKALIAVHMERAVRSHVKSTVKELGLQRCLGTVLIR